MTNIALNDDRRDRTRTTLVTESTATTVSSGALLESLIASASEADVQAPQRDIEGAVYGHIQALRALGRTRVNTAEIAEALNLPLKLVERTVATLTHKGVKIGR